MTSHITRRIAPIRIGTSGVRIALVCEGCEVSLVADRYRARRPSNKLQVNKAQDPSDPATGRRSQATPGGRGAGEERSRAAAGNRPPPGARLVPRGAARRTHGIFRRLRTGVLNWINRPRKRPYAVGHV